MSSPPRLPPAPCAVADRDDEKERVVASYLVGGEPRRPSLVAGPRLVGPAGSAAPPSVPEPPPPPRPTAAPPPADDDVGCPSHRLMGGSMVRDVYKWYETATGAGAVSLKRSRSHNDAHDSRRTAAPSHDHGGDQNMKTPGGFRRQFVHSRAKLDGRKPPRTTSSFLGFLHAQGRFDGEYPPELERDVSGPPYVCPERIFVEAAVNNPDVAVEDPTPKQHQISATKACLMMLKGFVGTGVLFLPKAFAHGGFLFSLATLIFMGVINWLAMQLLVECRNKVPGSFGEIAGKLFGPRVRVMVKTSIVIMQLGMCCCYVIFVGKTTQNVVSVLSHGAVDWPLWLFILIDLLFYVPMSWIRKINKLSAFVLVANSFVIFGLGYVCINSIITLANNGIAEEFRLMDPKAVYINTADFTLFVGVAVFSFEGIGLVSPIIDAMAEPEKFPIVLKISVLIATVVFGTCASLCYLAYGGSTQEIAFANFAPGDPVGIAVKILYAFAVLLSVPLFMFPAIRIMETPIFAPRDSVAAAEKVNSIPAAAPPSKRIAAALSSSSGVRGSGRASGKVKWLKNSFRLLVCLATVAVALAGSTDFEKFVNLVGAFACVPLMFIYPAAFHYAAVATTRRHKFMDLALIVVGFISMVFVSAVTIDLWIKESGSSGEHHGIAT